MWTRLSLLVILIFCVAMPSACTTTKILPPNPRQPAASVKDLTARPKLEKFTDIEWKKLADPTLIPVVGKFQRYQVNVEARFDEDEDAIGLLDEQLLKPVVMEEKKATPKKWYQFWK